MTSSTTRAFMAKKPFATASAFMAKTNQLFSTIARLRLLLVMFLTLTVSANVWGATLTLNNLGSSLSGTSNTIISTTTITATGNNTSSYTINYLQCKKQTNSSLSAMFLTKSTGAFISNKTAMPGNIKSVTVYVLTGASNSTTYHCAFSTTECTSAYTTGSTAVNIKGGSSNKYTCTVSNAKYFCISLGNANNGQVYKLDVEYETAAATTYTVTLNPNYPEGKTGVFKDKSDNTINGNLVLSYPSGTASMQITSLYNSLTLDGYEFGGWYNAKGINPGDVSGSPCTNTGNITGHKTYYAKWTQKVYTVTATSNNNNYGTVSVSGTTITASPKTGYTYANPAYTVTSGTATVTQNGNTFTITPSTNCTIRINFEAKPKYTVTLVPGSGSVTDTELEEPNAGDGVTLPTPTLSSACQLEGWSFAGWTTSSVANETSSKPATLLTGTYKPTSNITLYAVYKRIEETEGTPTITTTTDKLTRATTGITGTSYSSWSGKTSNSDAVYAGQSAGGNEAIQLRSNNNNSGVITTASGGKAKKVTVVWNSNTADGRTLDIYGKNSAYSAATDLYSTSTQGTKLGSIAKGSTTLTITGDYEYIGLRSNSGAMYLTSISIDWTTTTGGGSTTTTYYHSTPDCGELCTDAVTISKGTETNGTFTLSTTDQQSTCNGPVTVTLSNIEPATGYQFSAITQSGVDAAKVTIDNTAKTVTYAQNTSGTSTINVSFTPAVYTINYKDQGGANFSGTHEEGCPKTHTYNAETTLKSASKDHYTFGGWYKESDCSGTEVTTLGATDYTNNITLYAKWTANQYTVTFNTNGHGTAPATQTIEYGSKVSKPTNPTAAGYEFSGWYKDAGCTEKYDFNTLVTGNVTLYAKWLKIVNVKWVVNGQSIGSSTSSEGTSFTPPAVNTIPCGAVLAGWTDAENGVYEHGTSTLYEGAQPSIPITDDKTFYAVFADLEGAVPEMPTVIAYWENQALTKDKGVAAKIGTGTMTSNIRSNELRTKTAYFSNINTQPIIELTNLDLISHQDICLSFWTRGSAGGAFTIKINDNTIATINVNKNDETLYIIENIPSTTTSITLSYGANSGSFFFGTVKLYEAPAAYSFEKLTAENTNGWTGSDWDGYYLITNGQSPLRALDGNAIFDGGYKRVEDSDNKVEALITMAFNVTYNSTESGYSLQGVGDGMYLNPTGSGGKEVGSNANAIYFPTIGYNQLKTSSNMFLSWNTTSNLLRFYNPSAESPQMYKIMSELSNYRTLCEYEVTWLVGGEEYIAGTPTTTVQAGKTITTLPTNPTDDALGCCSDKFMGWTTSTAKTIEDQYLYETIEEIQAKFPSIYEDLTFRAVFATTAQGVGTSIADFSEMGYENGTTVTDPIVLGDGEGHGDATITFAKAQSSSKAPTYYTDGGAVRIYAGGTITIASTYNNATIKNIVFTFAGNDVVGENTITASSGTYDNGTWTGNASTVTFTIAGSTGHRRIASITVTTGVTGSQYTNYVTSCDKMNDPSLGAVQLTYNSGDAIAVNCGTLSSKNSAASITFPNAVNLTCPITVTAPAGFVLATNRQSDTYTQTVVIKPVKTAGENKGKITKTVYVRADAPENSETDYSSNITITGEEITETTVTVKADVTCKTYTFKTLTHIGDEHTSNTYYAGQIIEVAPVEPVKDACSENYTFDGWSTSEVEYGSLIYNKVSFPFTMPAADVTLIPVYRLLEDISKADYHRVTSNLGAGDVDGNNWAGDYLIAASADIFASGQTNELLQVGLNDLPTIINEIISADWGQAHDVSLIAVEGGYVLKTQDISKPYIYITDGATSGTPTDDLTTADDYPLTITWDEELKKITIHNAKNTKGYAINYSSNARPSRFGFFKATSIYLYKKSPLYTTSLICEEVTASDALVTSTADQTVKVNVPITLTSSLHRTTDITAESDNSHFTITNLSGIEEGNHTLAVHYRPTVTTDGIETANIKIKVNNLPVNTFQVTGRHLPEKFVIATKVGATWYALPADMSSATNPVGVVIEVDETTMTATAPNTTSYTLFPVKTTNTQYDRFAKYGDRVRFSAVNNGYKGLWANNSKTDLTINNDMVIDQASDGQTDSDWTNNSYYEWKVTTTVVDGHWQYTLQTDQTQNQNYLRYWVGATGAPKWGTYAAGNYQLYFLPVTETEPFDYQVVEWYPTKMLIQTDASIANPTAEIGDAPINNVTCTNKGSKLYEIAGLPLESNPTKVLTIKFSDGGNNYTNATAIPVIISQSATTVSSAPFTTLTKDVYNYADLVVRDGATLTIDGGTQAENTFFNVTIYPTSKITVPEGKRLTVHSLTFFGGIDEIYNGSTYTLNKYGVPELSLKGTLKKSISTIDYLMRVDSKQMYSLTVPYDVQLADIKYWDGTNIVLGDELWVSAYDGASRAQNQGNGKNWIYETDFESKLGAATLKAGVGYTISAELQSGVGNEYSILRMPMNSNVVNEASEVAKSVAVTAHGIDANITDNHKGWNLVGNPYMASITGADDNHLVLGYLQETGTGPWEWVNDYIRYVTIPSDDGTYYRQQQFTTAELPPFKNFFVQIGTTGELAFGLGTRQSMPARYLQQEQAPREVEFELLLSNEAQSDNMGLLISEEYTPAYEINADLEKMIGNMSVYSIYNGYQLAYTALSPLNAMEEIPLGYVLPSTGEYTFALDEHGDLDDIEHIYLLDYDKNTTTDLMEDIYTFAATEKKSDKRFAISVILKEEEEVETPTQLETLEWESDHPYKFIYQDKMYILRNGVIYDAMGKQVQTINK